MEQLKLFRTKVFFVLFERDKCVFHVIGCDLDTRCLPQGVKCIFSVVY